MKNRNLSTDTSSQRSRILNRLKIGPATTTQLRREDDVMMPAARIYELRHNENYNIKSHFVNESNENGIVHRVGKYVLHDGKYSEEGRKK